MTARARVRSTGDDRSVALDLLPGPRCRGCEATCLWDRAPPASLRLRGSGSHRPGDLVSVRLRNRHVLRGALLVHGLPWAGLLVGTAAGVAGLGGDPGASLGAIVGLGLGLFVGRRLDGRWRIRPQLVLIAGRR